MGLEFINVHTGEHRNTSDLSAALILVKARDWAIADPGTSKGSPAWEILVSSAPMKGVYPNRTFDTAAYTPDNVNLYLQRTGEMFTLRELVAWANTAPAVAVDPPVMDTEPLPYDPGPYVPPWDGPGDALVPPVDTSGLWPGASTVPPALGLGAGGPAPPLPWEVVPVVVPVGPGDPFYLPYAPPDPVVVSKPWPMLPAPAPMFPAPVWTVTIDDNGGTISTRPFPVRVVVEGKGRLVYSEAELSDALANGGHIAGPNDNGNITDIILRPEVEPPMEWPRPMEYVAPAAGFPWWLLLLGAGLAFSKRRG